MTEHRAPIFPARPWGTMGLVAVVVALVLVAGCARTRFGEPDASSSATHSAPASVDPSLGDGLTESQAIEAARQFLSTLDRDAPVWATAAGSFETVFSSLAHRPNYVEQPPPTDPEHLDRPIWGIQFHVTIELCGPSGTTWCDTRDGLQTVLIDYATGEKLRTTTYAPSSGEPLPTPLPIAD